MKKYNNIKMIISITIFLIILIFTDLSFAEINTNVTIRKSVEFKPVIENLLGFFQTVGTICSVGALIGIGIRYMMGSVEEKAEYKKTLLPYFIGAIMVFTTVNVAQLMYDVISNL